MEVKATKKIRRARISRDWKPDDLHVQMVIDPDFVKLAEFYYDVVSKRVETRTGDKLAIVDGWLAQICFQALLIERKIPFIPHVPLYSPLDPIYGEPYDFLIPFVGKVEVKGDSSLSQL